jgi:WD40 repeat protein
MSRLAALFVVGFALSALAQPPADGVPLPAGALHRFGSRLARHPDGIIGAVTSPDGKSLATVGNNSVIVWDVKTMAARCVLRDLNILNRYQVGQIGLAFLPDSKRMLVSVVPANETFVVQRERKVDQARVFDVDTGKLVYAIKGEMDYETAAWVAAGGKEIAVFSLQSIAYFDAATGKELRRVPCGQNVGEVLAVAPAAHLAAFQRNDGNNTLLLVDLKTGQQVDDLTSENLVRVGLTSDGKRLAVVDGAGKIHIRDVEDKKELFAFGTPAGAGVVDLHFSRDGQMLYFGGQHGRLYRWDLKANKKLPDVGSHSTWNLSGIALSPDESTLYSVGYNKVIRRWDLKTLKELPLPAGYMTQTTLVPLPDRKTMLVADHGGTIDQWDLATGKLVKQLQKPGSGGIDCVTVSADGRWFAGGRTTQDVTLWDLAAGKPEKIIPLVDKAGGKSSGSDHVKRVAFNAAGTTLFTTSERTGVTAWEMPSGKRVWNAKGATPWLAVDPMGRWIAAGGGYNREQVHWTLLNAATGEVIRKVDVHQDEMRDNLNVYYPPYLTDLTFTPDGSRLLTVHYDGVVRVWEPGTGREVGRLRGVGHGPCGLALSADGRWVAVGQSDKKITLWELASGKLLTTIVGHDSQVRDVAFTRDGRGVIGNADLAPVLWTLEARDVPKAGGDAWDVLATEDGAKAYKLQWALIKDPAAAVKLFNEKVKPAELALARSKFDQWVADLDSPTFRTREVAERELTRAGMRVPLGWVRQALADSKADEPRARLARVLGEREKPNPQEWRLLRAVQVLELAGTAEAVALLKSWAGVDGSPVTEPSRGAVGRLATR